MKNLQEICLDYLIGLEKRIIARPENAANYFSQISLYYNGLNVTFLFQTSDSALSLKLITGIKEAHDLRDLDCYIIEDFEQFKETLERWLENA